MVRAFMFFVLGLALVGCASTTVRQNPGPHDHGFRFYRPKPYLLLKALPTQENKDAPQFVSIEWQMLPDFSEQYSIHAHAGLGTNNTKVTLKDGWQLSQLDFDIDSKTDENIKAVGALIKSIGTQFAPSGGGATPPGKQVIAARLPARNVPLGLYEAVINRDSCGVKRLYGWRYVGFMPFTPCPINPTGSQKEDCAVGQIYGLVDEGGVMVFKQLDHIGQEEVARVVVPTGPATAEALKAAVDKAFAVLKPAAETALTEGNKVTTITVTARDRQTVTIVVGVEKMEVNLATAQMKLQAALQKAIRAQPGLNDVTLCEVEIKVMGK